MMTWNEYHTTLIPLISKFGAIHYSKQDISDGFYYWKSRQVSELLDEINRSISFNQPMSLKNVSSNEKRPERTKWQPEIYHQTEGYLERFLKQNDSTSLVDLLNKERAKLRK